MNNSPITPIKTRYLDAGTIQILLDSGEYTNARDAARAQGIEFATTQKIIAELANGSVNEQSDAVKRFNQNPENFIKKVDNPAGVDVTLPNSGEETLVRRIIEERAAGNSTSEIYTQDPRAIGKYRRDPATADIPFRRFGEGNIEGRPTPSLLDELYGNDPASYARTRDAVSSRVPNNSANPDGPAFNPDKPSHERLKSDGQLGIESQSRLNPETNAPEVRRVPAGTPTAGTDWVSPNEARAVPGSTLDRTTRKLTDGPRAELDRIRSDPASRAPSGDFTPDAQRGIDRAAKALGAAGLGVLLYDFLTTLDLVRRLNEQGQFDKAQREVAKFAGRTVIGNLGAAAGAYDQRVATMRQAVTASGQDNMNYSNAA